MQRTQVYEFANYALTQATGEQDILLEDLSNIIDAGTKLFDSGKVDNYVKALMNRIGRDVFDTKRIKIRDLGIFRDGWEYGIVMSLVRQTKLPEARENQSWQLENNTSYDCQLFIAPENIEQKFFVQGNSFEIPVSIAERQVKESFTSAEAIGRFIAMLQNNVQNAVDKKLNLLQMRLVNEAMAATLYDEYSNANYSSKSGVRAINLLYEYNSIFNDSLTAAEALFNGEFLRFASQRIGETVDRMMDISVLFNLSGNETWSENVKTVLISSFDRGAKTYLSLANGQFKDIALPEHTTVPYWQATGDEYALAEISEIKVVDNDNHTTDCTYIIGCAYDQNALMLCNEDRRVTSSYNAVAEFNTYYNKIDYQLFTDRGANFVVFFLA